MSETAQIRAGDGGLRQLWAHGLNDKILTGWD